VSRKPPAGHFDYCSNVANYSLGRSADPRIAEHILAALTDPRTVPNVGAGAGVLRADRPRKRTSTSGR
jgi:hypothetical protein